MNEGVVLSCIIGTNNTFSTDEINIIPDVYKLYLGETEQNIYLENNPVTINGYFDEKNPEQSSLSFTGIDPFLTLQNYMPAEKDPDIATISTSVKGKLTPAMASALAYLADVNDYQSNKMLLDMIPEQKLLICQMVGKQGRNPLPPNYRCRMSRLYFHRCQRKKRKSERLPWENCRT